MNGKHSAWAAVLSGVPEGSILGPILFACFAADIPLSIKSGCLLFADDVKLSHRITCEQDCQQLQSDINRLAKWHLASKTQPAKMFRHNIHTAHGPHWLQLFHWWREAGSQRTNPRPGGNPRFKIDVWPPCRLGNG